MQPTTAGLATATGTDRVGESGALVDHDVVRRGDVRVESIFIEHRRLAAIEVAQPGEVEHLHTMLTRPVRDDVGVVHVGLDVTPRAAVRSLGHRKDADHNRVRQVGDVDERGPVGHADERVEPPGLRVFPAPVVIRANAAGVVARQLENRHERYKVDLAALPLAGLTVLATDFFTPDGVESLGLALHDRFGHAVGDAVILRIAQPDPESAPGAATATNPFPAAIARPACTRPLRASAITLSTPDTSSPVILKA